ncbi:hypothetical protein [Micromonospora sp. NPDC005174]
MRAVNATTLPITNIGARARRLAELAVLPLLAIAPSYLLASQK